MSIKDLITRKDRDLVAHTRRDDPFAEFHREMNRLFEDFFTDFSVAPSWNTGLAAAGAFSPRVNVSESEKEVVIEAELPGLDKKEVNVELQDNAVVISGEKKEEHEEKNKKWHRVEHSYGSFQRVIPLPANVNAGAAKAEFKKGLLTVSLPKLEKESVKKNTIEISSD